MIKYTPCLKLKQNEMNAIKELDSEVVSIIKPLLDLPRVSKNQTEQNIAERIEKGLKYLGSLYKKNKIDFYLDNFDLDEDIKINGVDQYDFILSEFDQYSPVPVLALDRNVAHNRSAYKHILKRGKAAIRLQKEDLEGYNITKIELEDMYSLLAESEIKEIDLIVDLRVINDQDEDFRLVNDFMSKFVQDFSYTSLIMTGSIIPANIGDLIPTDQILDVVRLEQLIWRRLIVNFPFRYGDYGVVSPEYSDYELEPHLLPLVATPKVFYTYDDNYFVLRGNSLKRNPRGNEQFFDIADEIVNQVFFRGVAYSFGEKYVYDRSCLASSRPSKAGSQGSWVKAMVCVHINYIKNYL